MPRLIYLVHPPDRGKQKEREHSRDETSSVGQRLIEGLRGSQFGNKATISHANT